MSLRAGRQELDAINVPQAVVAFISAISLVVLTIIGVYATTHNINWSSAQSSGVKQVPSAPPKFGMLHQTLFGTESDAADVKKKALDELDSYGWVDKERQIVHIPIEMAKRKLVEGHAK